MHGRNSVKIKLNLSLREFAVIQFSAVTLLLVFGAGTYVFMHLSGHDYVLGFLRLLDVGKERSIPTYFSALNLLLAFVLLFVIYRYERENEPRGSRYWLFLSLVFLALSVDEAAAIHENFARVQKYLAARELVPAMVSHEWVPFGALFVLIVGTILIPFVKRLPRDTALLFLAAGFVFVLGAVGFETLGAWMLASGFVESSRDPIYQTRRLAEEGLEMYGIAIFNLALYREVLRRNISIEINPREPE